MKRLLSIAFVLLCSSALFGQGAVTTTLQVQNSGSTVFTRSGFIRMNFTAGCTASVVSGSLNLACTGSANNPGGTANQIQWNSAGTSFAGFTMSGDCTIVVATGVITCTKTNGTAFGALATAVPGSGVATFLTTPSSANLLAALTTKTGTGNAVFGTAPTISSAILSTAAQLSYITGIAAQCLHVDTSGNITGTGSDCGAGGGGTTTNALTINNSNSGAASGGTFNGSAPVTISTNTIGAPNLATANTYSGGGLQDFSASTIKLPFGAGFTTTANGNQGYDTTNLNWHIWQNGADRINAVINGATTNGDCTKFVVSGSTVSLQDTGVACATFSGNTTVAVSAGTGVNTATTQTHLVADGSGNAIPQSKITTVGMGGVWTNGMPFGIPVTIGTVATPVNTTMYVQQFPVVNQQTIGNATFDATTCASCAEVLNACLYDSTAATLLWSGISATFNATGAFSATGTQATIQPGVYYFAYSFSGTTAPSVQGYSAGAGATDNILNKNGTRVATATNGISGGLCPSSLGVLNPSTGTAAHVAFALEP